MRGTGVVREGWGDIGQLSQGPIGHRKELGFNLREGEPQAILSRRVTRSDLRYFRNEPMSECVPGSWKIWWREYFGDGVNRVC